jgi:hypothetical protein
LGNAVNRGQPQTRAFADFLGGEKRFKDMGRCFMIHPDAGVGNGKQHVPARPGLVGSETVFFTDPGILRLDHHPPPSGMASVRWIPGSEEALNLNRSALISHRLSANCNSISTIWGWSVQEASPPAPPPDSDFHLSPAFDLAAEKASGPESACPPDPPLLNGAERHESGSPSSLSNSIKGHAR